MPSAAATLPPPPADPWWTLDLQGKPDFDAAMRRIYAWWSGEIIDRIPIRFAAHNADFAVPHHIADRTWPDLKARWFDAEYQVDYFIAGIEGRRFHAETFPVFWPNLGPEIFAAFFGCELEYGDTTSYAIPCVETAADIDRLRFSRENPYFRKIEEMTRLALDKCEGRFLVGYTDLHGGLDSAAAWRDPMQLCVDTITDPGLVRRLVALAMAHFQDVYDYFDAMVKGRRQPSVTWMGIPSFGKMHIPSCDFAALISSRTFEEFGLPELREEVKSMTHNVFHIDGRGVLRHRDMILSVPGIQAIQWVQGMGLDMPIMQWVPLLKEFRAAGKSLVIDLQLDELEDFIAAMEPEGLLLCLAADEDIQPDIIKRVAKW
jgi:hypothetical protein